MSPSPTPFVIGDHTLDLATYAGICRGEVPVRLGDGARDRIARCDAFRQRLLESDRRIYGVNTGFGKLADTVIPSGDLAQLQRNEQWLKALLASDLVPAFVADAGARS